MQQIAIISSSRDPAGISIRNNLLELFEFEKTDEKFYGNEVFRSDGIRNKTVKSYLPGGKIIPLKILLNLIQKKYH